MQTIISLHQSLIGGELQPCVNARELHAFLQSKQRFSDWIKSRIDQYQFSQDIDFSVIHNFMNDASAFGGKRKHTDYHLTLDMAKELSMVERNAKGRQARRYFIECERIAKATTRPSGGTFRMSQEEQATAGSRRHDFEAASGRCRHAPDIETHMTHAVDHLTGALHSLTEALQQAQGRRRQQLSHLVQNLAPSSSPPSPPAPSCYSPEPENALSESMQDKLAAWLTGRSRCTLYEVCLEVFGIPPEDLNRAGQTRLGCMLKNLGWVSQRETVAPNQRVKVYRPVEG